MAAGPTRKSKTTESLLAINQQGHVRECLNRESSAVIYTPSISHSSRPLAAEPKRNVENVESLLALDQRGHVTHAA